MSILTIVIIGFVVYFLYIRYTTGSFQIPKIKNPFKNINPYTDKDIEYHKEKNEKIKNIDDILDKISKQGINNLTKAEKDFLKNINNK